MSSHIPRLLALDGLRAVSILLVVVSHVLSLAKLNLVPGGLGVTIFFFISGFIITHLLLDEGASSGSVGLAAFYQRRVWRLAPALLVFTACSWLAMAALGGGTPLMDVVAALFYFANYHGIYSGFGIEGLYVHTPPLSITWSLAVEEHFYMVFPLLVLATLGRPGRLLATMLGVIAAALAWRCYLVFGVGLESLPSERIYKASDTRLDSIAWGCLLSVMFHRAGARPGGADARLLALLSHPVALYAGGALLLATLALRSEAFRQSLRYSLQGLALTPLFCALFWQERAPRLLRGLLESRPMVWIGALSYSLYLYHFLALALAFLMPGPVVLRMGFVAVAGLLMAMASYYWIETPVRRFGMRHLWQPRPRLRPDAAG